MLNAFFPKAMFLFSCLVFSTDSYEKTDHELAFCLVSIKGKILGVNIKDPVFQLRKSLMTGRNCPGASEESWTFQRTSHKLLMLSD